MTKSSAFLLRLYFIVVSIITLVTLMFGAIDLLSIGLKTYIFTAADVPSYLENCAESRLYEPVAIEESEKYDYVAQCEARNKASIENYQRTKASDAVQNISLLIVSIPLFLLHFRIVYRDWKKTQEE